MSVLEKCEKIGVELRSTPEGEQALKYLRQIENITADEIAKVEFFKLINKYSLKLHFYAVENAIDIFKANDSNSEIKWLVDSVLSIEGLEEFGECNTRLGAFVQGLDHIAFSNSVHYQLPKDITATAKLIRLCNSLTVECQRIDWLPSFLKEYYTDPNFKEAISRFDQLSESKRILPFSRKDRMISKILKKEFPDSKTQLIHHLVRILAYIKCVIFDSFYDNLYEVREEDICSYREIQLTDCKYIKAVLKPSCRILDSNRGWILKLCSNKMPAKYAQLISKRFEFNSRGSSSVTIKAILYHGL